MYLKYRDVLNIFMRHLPKNHQGGEIFTADGEPFFRACIEILRSDENGGAIEAVYCLNRFSHGYSCWLDDIYAAIDAAEPDFPTHYQDFYQRFKGAAAMAGAYLLNVDWLDDDIGAGAVHAAKRRQPKTRSC